MKTLSNRASSPARTAADAPSLTFGEPQIVVLEHFLYRRLCMWPVCLELLRCTLWLGISLGLTLSAASVACGQANADQALRGFPKSSWYDPQTQRWLPPSVEPVEDEPLRQEGRVNSTPPAPPTSGSTSNGWWDWVPSWFDLTWLGPWLRVLIFAGLCILIAICVAILTHFALRNYLPQRFRGQVSAAGVSIDPARIADLPFDVAAVEGDPLAQAKHYMQEGNLDAAILCLYGYLLLVLDQSRLIHLQKGKTNRMYLRELRGTPRLHEILQQCMLAFESCYFGKHAVSTQQFMAVWLTLDEFHRLLHTPLSPQREATLSAEVVS